MHREFSTPLPPPRTASLLFAPPLQTQRLGLRLFLSWVDFQPSTFNRRSRRFLDRRSQHHAAPSRLYTFPLGELCVLSDLCVRFFVPPLFLLSNLYYPPSNLCPFFSITYIFQIL